MGYRGKVLKKLEKSFRRKLFPKKTIQEIVSIIVHRKNSKKQNSKTKNLFSIENRFHKNLSQASYQWGTQESYSQIKLKNNRKLSTENHV